MMTQAAGSRARLLTALALVVLPLAPLASGQSSDDDACEVQPEAIPFAQPRGWIENLAFDGAGNLYATDMQRELLLRYAPDGRLAGELPVAPLPVGLAVGPDGHLYVGVGMGPGAAEVRRYTAFDPLAYDTYASGLGMANGLAFDDGGNLYASSNVFEPGLVRIPPQAPRTPVPWSDLSRANGLWHDAHNQSLLAVVTRDATRSIVQIPYDTPATPRVVATLPKPLDDLTLGPDGMLYAAAYAAGEILRIDPADGTACVLASGLHTPTSIRIAHGFGGWDGKLFVSLAGGYLALAPGGERLQPGGLVVLDLPPPVPAEPTDPPERNIPSPAIAAALTVASAAMLRKR